MIYWAGSGASHPELIESCLRDKVVMVTGAGGSIAPSCVVKSWSQPQGIAAAGCIRVCDLQD